MIRCFLPKDVGTVCTKIPGAWVHNKKQNINDNISFVPSSHCCFFFFFICRLYPWVPLLLLLAFLTSDLQLSKGKFCFVLFSIWKAPSAWTWLSLHVTPIPQEHHGPRLDWKGHWCPCPESLPPLQAPVSSPCGNGQVPRPSGPQFRLDGPRSLAALVIFLAPWFSVLLFVLITFSQR